MGSREILGLPTCTEVPIKVCGHEFKGTLYGCGFFLFFLFVFFSSSGGYRYRVIGKMEN